MVDALRSPVRVSDSEGRRKRLYDKRHDPKELHNVAADHPQMVDRLWRVLEDEAGGALPQLGASGARAVIGGVSPVRRPSDRAVLASDEPCSRHEPWQLVVALRLPRPLRCCCRGRRELPEDRVGRSGGPPRNWPARHR